jgi:predicted DNA-binding transcriptional regulator AlpA
MATDARTRLVQQTTESADAEPEFWSIQDIQFNCRIGRTTAWQLVRHPKFPCPLAIGAKRLVWSRQEVLLFLDGLRRPDHYTARLTPRQALPYDFVVRRIGRRSEDS